MDFSERTDFIALYIPSSNHGFECALALADAVRPMLSSLPQRLGMVGGDSGGITKLEDLTFTGRVFIYHEWPLSNKEKADIVEAYSAKGLDVQFRGIDYLNNRLKDWLER